jgi:hypothetical protein
VTATNRAERLKQLSPQKRLLLLQALRQQTANAETTTTISRRTPFSPAPLSLAQQRLWFLAQLAPGNPSYNISAAVRLQGRLDVAALERSFNEVVRRHEALRTTFATLNGEPVQVITPTLSFKLAVVNLQKLPEPDRQAEVERSTISEAQYPFDLTAELLLRVTLLQLSETESVALLTVHHIISDGWSIAVLVQEVATLYPAFCENKSSPLADLPIQFADFAVWQQHSDQIAKLKNQLHYWKQQLSGAALLPPLPTDRPRSTAPTFRGAQRSFLLPLALTDALKALSQQAEATLFMTLLTAFQSLLYCYTQQNDILVGTPIANRNLPELENLIGCFVNTLVLRTRLDADFSFRDVLARSCQVTLEAFAHADVPFEKLVEELQPQRSLSYNPLFQVWFALHNTPLPSLELPGLSISPLAIESGTTRHDLSLHLWETPSGLQGTWEYKTDLFDAATCDRLIQHFTAFLNKIVAEPDIQLSELAAMFAEAEKQYRLQYEHDIKAANLNKLKFMRRKAQSTLSD